MRKYRRQTDGHIFEIQKSKSVMRKQTDGINYLLLKDNNYYRVEERPIFDISDIQGIYLSSTTHRDDAYNAAEVLNYLISRR